METQTKKTETAQGAKTERKPSLITMYKTAKSLWERMREHGDFTVEDITHMAGVVDGLKDKVLEEM